MQVHPVYKFSEIRAGVREMSLKRVHTAYLHRTLVGPARWPLYLMRRECLQIRLCNIFVQLVLERRISLHVICFY